MELNKAVTLVAQWLDMIPQAERQKLDGLEFIFDFNTIKIVEGGNFSKGTYYKNNSIIFYLYLIKNEQDLKETFLHEICHHFGMNEETTRRTINEIKSGS
jgi:hypothetical protein